MDTLGTTAVTPANSRFMRVVRAAPLATLMLCYTSNIPMANGQTFVGPNQPNVDQSLGYIGSQGQLSDEPFDAISHFINAGAYLAANSAASSVTHMPPADIWRIALFNTDPMNAGPSANAHPRPKIKPRVTNRTVRREAKIQGPSTATGYHRSPRLLGSIGRVSSLSPLSKRWDRVKALGDSAQIDMAACLSNSANCGDRDITAWAEIVRKARTRNTGRQIVLVNQLVNRMLTYREDIDLRRRPEHWASPTETLSQRAGDCEDYAILKYWSLRQLGFKDQDMRIIALRDRAARENHAVLAIHHRGDWLILDNRFSRVRLQRDLPHYQPLYSVNRLSQWSHVKTNAKPVRLAARLKQLGLK